MSRGVLLLIATLIATGAGATTPQLCVAEDGGTGEDPPPIGQLSRFDTATGAKTVFAKGMEDPVWVSSSSGGGDGKGVYVSLFHSGRIMFYPFDQSVKPTLIATGLSCPEGVVVNGRSVYVNENPIGNECRQPPANLSAAATLTRLDPTGTAAANTPGAGPVMRHVNVTGLFAPHGLAPSVDAEVVYVCEWGLHQLTRVNVSTGAKSRVAPLRSPSGCAIDESSGSSSAYAYAVEQGDPGALVRIDLSSGAKLTLIDDLAEPNGVAVCGGYAYATERRKNAVRRVPVAGGKSEVFATGLKSPFGLSAC